MCPDCEDPRPHVWSMCAACFCPCISLSRATLGRSHYQISVLNTSVIPAELPTHTDGFAGGGGVTGAGGGRCSRARSLFGRGPLLAPWKCTVISLVLLQSRARSLSLARARSAPPPPVLSLGSIDLQPPIADGRESVWVAQLPRAGRLVVFNPKLMDLHLTMNARPDR